jgi:hypothetical protein
MVEDCLAGIWNAKPATKADGDFNSCFQPDNVAPDVCGCLVKKLHNSRPLRRVIERSAGIDAESWQLTSPDNNDLISSQMRMKWMAAARYFRLQRIGPWVLWTIEFQNKQTKSHPHPNQPRISPMLGAWPLFNNYRSFDNVKRQIRLDAS